MNGKRGNLNLSNSTCGNQDSSNVVETLLILNANYNRRLLNEKTK